MLEHILKLYVMAMKGDVRSPLPHLFGPPGCGKSTVVEELAELVKKKLFIVNVSRLSPLEIEGVQMPVGMDTDSPRLHLLLSTLWSHLEEGDIILLDEFLRGFPEVYNGLLDIITSRQVAGHKLPKVFIIAASNSTVSYDKALEDRLLHIPVPDPRKKKAAKKAIAQILVDQCGLYPLMRDSQEMTSLLDTEVLPMFEILDQLGKSSASAVTLKGTSVRNLIGQVKLREIHSPQLKELLVWNNRKALGDGKYQFIILPDGKSAPPDYLKKTSKWKPEQLSEIQALNLDLNKQLIQLEEARREKEGDADDDQFIIDDEPPF